MEFCEREYKEIVSVTESLVDKAIEKEKKHFEKTVVLIYMLIFIVL